ncbi:MAG: DNA-directed RNA polymerase subunit omega [Acutalibacteraceae bacterium]|nr:DNA-directed RNA polymerase subunit omega [Oscillospiraceae bacterium]
MMNPNLNKILKGKTSRYSLVTAVAKRAREISEDKDMAEKLGTEKPVTYALNELIEGKYTIVEPEEIRNI